MKTLSRALWNNLRYTVLPSLHLVLYIHIPLYRYLSRGSTIECVQGVQIPAIFLQLQKVSFRKACNKNEPIFLYISGDIIL